MSAPHLGLTPQLKALASTTCWCGKTKAQGSSKTGVFAVCHRCWFQLPKPMKASLYFRAGAGFEAAYEAAVEFLKAAKA